MKKFLKSTIIGIAGAFSLMSFVNAAASPLNINWNMFGNGSNFNNSNQDIYNNKQNLNLNFSIKNSPQNRNGNILGSNINWNVFSKPANFSNNDNFIIGGGQGCGSCTDNSSSYFRWPTRNNFFYPAYFRNNPDNLNWKIDFSIKF